MWNEEIECMSREDIFELQLKKLQATVKRAFDKIPFYTEKYTNANVFPEDIETLKDIEKLPFLTKDDLRACYPFGMFAVDKKEIIEVHSSSGTTGKPVVSGYTQSDIDNWGEIVARGLTMMGLDEDDIIPGQTRRQVEIMADFGSTCLIFTPSYGIYLGEVAKEEGIDFDEIGLKAIGFGAEMWTAEMRDRIEETFKTKAYNIYGLTELMGPGIGMECCAQNGLHIAEDFFYPEIIDPKTGITLPEGTHGELVLTNLERESMPVIRFRTKDLTALHYDTCECGRTLARMERITGRSDDMIKVKGVAVFPSQIEKALLKVSNIEPHYQIIVTRPDIMDEIEIKVEASEALFSDDIKEMMGVKRKIGEYIQNEIGIAVNVSLVAPKSIPRSTKGKIQRVIDKRNLH